MANVATLTKEIKTLRSNLDNDAIPAEFKDNMKNQLEKLEKELAETVGEAAKPAIDKIVKKAVEKTANKKLKFTLRKDESNVLAGFISMPSARKEYDVVVFVKPDQLRPLQFDNAQKALEKVTELVQLTYKNRKDWGVEFTDEILSVLEKLQIYDGDEKKNVSVKWTVQNEWADLTDEWEEDKHRSTKKLTPAVKNKAGMTDAECEELIQKEKERLAKRKKAEKRREAKPEPAKQRERVDKVTDVVENSIKERIASGKPVKKAEVEALIRQYEEAITDLKKILKTL
jgi:hypothetical protein